MHISDLWPLATLKQVVLLPNLMLNSDAEIYEIDVFIHIISFYYYLLPRQKSSNSAFMDINHIIHVLDMLSPCLRGKVGG